MVVLLFDVPAKMEPHPFQGPVAHGLRFWRISAIGQPMTAGAVRRGWTIDLGGVVGVTAGGGCVGGGGDTVHLRLWTSENFC